jgi:hypothetical protein
LLKPRHRHSLQTRNARFWIFKIERDNAKIWSHIMGLFSGLKFTHYIASAAAKAGRNRNRAAQNAMKAQTRAGILRVVEADVAPVALGQPELNDFLKALRKAIGGWEDSRLADETAAKACQAVIDATRAPIDVVKMKTANANMAASNALYLSDAARARAINLHKELRSAGKALSTVVSPPMPLLDFDRRSDFL